MNIRPTKETILKILIALGIIGIGVSLFVQYGQPYLKERALEKLDEKRISDLDALNKEIQDILTTSSTMKLGEEKTVYISLPSDDPTCKDLDLPTLADGWRYHCANKTEYQKTDGSGWLPINLNTKSVIGTTPLSVDPDNDPSTLSYYELTIASATTTHYTLSSSLKTKKYQIGGAQTDNGVDPTRYETGNSQKIIGFAQALVAYWQMNNLSDNQIIFDGTENHNDILLPVDDLYSHTDCLQGNCIKNTRTTSKQITIPSLLTADSDLNFSYGFWFNIERIPGKNIQLFNPGVDRLDVNIEGETGALFVWLYNHEKKGTPVYKSASQEFSDGKWHQIFIIKNNFSVFVYIDGKQVQNLRTTAPVDQTIDHGSIGLSPDVSVDEISIYKKALTKKEISNIFLSLTDGTKSYIQ